MLYTIRFGKVVSYSVTLSLAV